jgi:acyl-coenzyme A synthetase/AMP-(fatty) acid ligase
MKLRGFRIEPAEIEEAARRMPTVSDAVAVLRAGADQPSLVLYARPNARAGDFDCGELHRELARVLPRHMVPTAIVEVEQFPLTPSGKTDRGRLVDGWPSSGRDAERGHDWLPR